MKISVFQNFVLSFLRNFMIRRAAQYVFLHQKKNIYTWVDKTRVAIVKSMVNLVELLLEKRKNI